MEFCHAKPIFYVRAGYFSRCLPQVSGSGNSAEYGGLGRVDREAFRAAGKHGFLMVWPEEKHGGMGDKDFRFEQVIIEETAYARCADWFNTLHSRLVGPYITRFGSTEQQGKL